MRALQRRDGNTPSDLCRNENSISQPQVDSPPASERCLLWCFPVGRVFHECDGASGKYE